MRTFAFLQKSTFPKNQDFHQKSLHMRVLILSKLVYIKSVRMAYLVVPYLVRYISGIKGTYSICLVFRQN